MKRILSGFLVLVSVGILPLWANDTLFEDESLTVTVSGNYLAGAFDKVKTTKSPPAPGALRYELTADNPGQVAPGLDLTLALNMDDVFIAGSVFGVAGLRTNGESTLETVFYGDTDYDNPVPFWIEQYLCGALIEAGWCSTATEWVYVLSGASAGTTYGDPVFHFGFGVGPYLHTIVTDQAALSGTTLGWTGSFRFQYLLWEGLGLEASSRIFLSDGMNRVTGTFGLGLLYKLL